MILVIDIQEEVKAIIVDNNINACDIDVYDCLMIAVSNATSLEKVLEDIKAEIEHELNRNTSGNEMFGKGLKCGYGECIAIIDSYISGKPE